MAALIAVAVMAGGWILWALVGDSILGSRNTSRDLVVLVVICVAVAGLYVAAGS
jgi:uncharacterized membrane protein